MRERILKLYKQGQSTAEIAAFCGYCMAAVRRVRPQFQVRGTVKPQTELCGRKTFLTDWRKAQLQALMGPGRMPPWPSCGPGWTVSFARRPWISGGGGRG